jgi:hypothetical protein
MTGWEDQMALSWGTLIAGLLFLSLPLAILLLNKRKRNAGWLLLLCIVTFVVVGNVAEKMITGGSPLF